MQSREIVERLRKANDAYRQGNPIMSDAEFDELERKLKEVEPESEWFDKGVNDSVPKSRKVVLPKKMMSLNKIKTIAELVEWCRMFKSPYFVVTPKFDGLSVGFNSMNKDAFTRGNGSVGQDCYNHFVCIEKKPDRETLNSMFGENVFVRGEIAFRNEDFERFHQKHADAKNSRNSATGLINGDYSKDRICDYRDLSVFCYDIPGSSRDKKDIIDSLNFASRKNNKVPYQVFSIREIERRGFERKLLSLFQEWRKSFPMDGLVFDVNDGNERMSAGFWANGNPKGTIAYKDEEFSNKADVEVGNVVWQENRFGILTPVIEFKEPVVLSGAEVSKVNGINAKYLFDWGIWKGVRLTVVRSGDVIPKIVAVEGVKIPFRDSYTVESDYLSDYGKCVAERQNMEDYIQRASQVLNDSYCLECGCRAEWDESKLNFVCLNGDCPGKAVQNIYSFCSTMGMKNFGEESARDLMKIDGVQSWKDIIYISEGELANLEGWGKKSIDSFLSEVKRIFFGSEKLARFLHATGFFGMSVGEKILQKVFDCYDEIEGLTKEDFLKIPGIQEKTANVLVAGFEKYGAWLKISPEGCRFKLKDEIAEGVLAGQKYCFTGFRDAQLKAKLEAQGCIVTDSFNKTCTALVVAENGFESKKTESASKWGIPILVRYDL